jgi:hypothetical protein
MADAKGSHYLDLATAKQAVEQVLPFIREAMNNHEVGESGFLHIVVMDPALTSLNASFDEAILYEHSIGNRAEWDADYQAFARAKAKISWSTGMSSQMVQDARPHLLRRGDTRLWGSATVDGIIVATSGAHAWYDEAFSGMLAFWLKARSQARARKHTGDLFVS